MKALSFGAVLWDIIEGREYIGGAPFNLAAHLAQCGDEVTMLTRIGQDRLGERAREEMARLGVGLEQVQTDPVHPTGWAKVTLSDGGVPEYEFPPDPAYNFIDAEAPSVEALRGREFDVVCFGTLEQKGDAARMALHYVLDSVDAAQVFYDVNVRLDFYPAEILRESLAKSTIVKLNAEEVELLSHRLYGEPLAQTDFVARLNTDFKVQTVCVTEGADGCTVHANGQSKKIPSPPVKVADTVGAGDAFSAAFLHEFCRGRSPFEAAATANQLGAFVASSRGAVPSYNDEIRRLLGVAETGSSG